MAVDLEFLNIARLSPATAIEFVSSHGGKRVGLVAGELVIDGTVDLLPYEIKAISTSNTDARWYQVPTVEQYTTPGELQKPERNPFSPTTFSLTEQGTLFKLDRAKYDRLKTAAETLAKR